MKSVYATMGIASTLYRMSNTCTTMLTEATVRACATKVNGPTHKCFKAAQINALNSFRRASAMGDPAISLTGSANTTSYLLSKLVDPVTVALPNLPGLSISAAVVALMSLVGTGTKPNFVDESSSRVVKGFGVLYRYGLVGIGEYAALMAADSQYAKRYSVVEPACMVVACIFAGALEPVRGALALFNFVSRLPFAVGGAILSAAIGVFLACRTKSTDPAAYTFGLDDLLPDAKILSEQKHFEDLIDKTAPFIAALAQAPDRSHALRIIKSHSDPNFTANVEDLATSLAVQHRQAENSDDKAQLKTFAVRLLGGGPQNNNVSSLYRKLTLFLHPDKLANLSKQSVSSEIAALANAAFCAATCARDICAEPLVCENGEQGKLDTMRGEPPIARLEWVTVS